MNNYPRYYCNLPATVRYDKRLKPNEKILYGEISALCSKNGKCFAGNKYFAELYGKSKDTISRWIRHLVTLNYLTSEIVYKEGSKKIEKRILRININSINEKIYTPIDQKVNTYRLNSQEGIDQKVKENNTRVNNTRINNAAAVVDIDKKSLIELVEESFGRTLVPLECEEIQSWEDNELTRFAIKQAILNDVRKIKYISSILYNYKKDNITSVIQAQEQEKQFKQ